MGLSVVHCQCYTWRAKCNVCWMPSPCQTLPDSVGVGPALKGHLAVASVPAAATRDGQESTWCAPYDSQKYHCQVLQENRKRHWQETDFWQEAYYMTFVLCKISPSSPTSDLSCMGLYLQLWISLTSSQSESPKRDFSSETYGNQMNQDLCKLLSSG